MTDAELAAMEEALARKTAAPTTSFTASEQDPKLAAMEEALARKTAQSLDLPPPDETRWRQDLPGNVAASLPSVIPEGMRDAMGSGAGVAADIAPEMAVPQAARIQEYEDLPDLIRAPAIRSKSGLIAMGTNAGADEVEQILKKNNPGTEVESKEGYKVYSFPGDPQKYAWKPGMRWSDIARAAPGVIGSIGAGMALAPAAVAGAPAAAMSVPMAIVANVVQSLLGEGAQAAVGGNADYLPPVVAGAAPLVIPFAKGVAGAAGWVLDKAAALRGQTAESLVDPLVQAGQDLMVRLGANRNLSGLAQDVAGATGPAAEVATQVATVAGAKAETATVAAAAKAEAERAAARTAAKDAVNAARTTAQGATTKVANQLQDDVAAASAKAEAEKAAAHAPVDSILASTTQALQQLGAGEKTTVNKKFLDHAMDLFDGLTAKGTELFEQIKRGFPKDARIQPGDTLDALQAELDKELVGWEQSKLVQRIKRATAPRQKGNAIQMPYAVDISRMKQLVSAVGHGKVAEYAGPDEAIAKHLGPFLKKVEDQAAHDYGMGDLLEKAQAFWAERQSYRGDIKKVLTLQGERALRDGTVGPAMDAAVSAIQKRETLSLEQIMAVAKPAGMGQEVMANIVNHAIDPSKGPEHMISTINAIRKSPEFNKLVFENLPDGARGQILRFAADTERALVQRGKDIAATEAAKKAEETALRRAARTDKRSALNTQRADTAAARETRDATVRKATEKEAGTVAAANISRKAAEEVAAQAGKLDIALAPKLRAAGRSILDGDVRPYEEMLKSTPGREKEIAMSTLYHALVDPTKKGADALKHMTEGLMQLEANPTARKLLLSKVPGAESSIRAVTTLFKQVHSGTAAGGKKAEGMLAALADMGPWAAGRTAGTGAAIATGAMGGTFATATGVGLGAAVLGRILMSKFAKDPTIKTKAANAFLASSVGRGLLKRFALDKPVTQGYLNWAANTAPVKAAARVHNMEPVAFVRKLLAGGSEHVLREAGEQALTPNDTKEE